jgi:membrane protein involved in colicin uptake
MTKNITIVLLLVLAAGCSSKPQNGAFAPPMDPARKVNEQECTRPIDTDGGNLMCRAVTEAERRARIAEEERLATARREAEALAARERLERERAEQLAREEAARQARAAEEERLAAERRRLEAEAARKALEERERRERAEAEARAAREAAERECRRLEQERSDGRAHLADFVATYGKVEEFKAIAGQITAFLNKASMVKPCPPA